jgi:hypothetical protein
LKSDRIYLSLIGKQRGLQGIVHEIVDFGGFLGISGIFITVSMEFLEKTVLKST